jgi:imidazolonepropionase-like amidohydrolase
LKVYQARSAGYSVRRTVGESLKPGKYADMIAVTGDPLADIRLLENIQFVMKDGKVYKQ